MRGARDTLFVPERRRSRRLQSAVRARDVRAADLQEEPRKRVKKQLFPGRSFRRIRRRRRLPGEHRSERSEPLDTASAASGAILLVDAVCLVDGRHTAYGAQHVIQVRGVGGLERELGSADAIFAGVESGGQDVDVLV